nr:5' exonuclease Apollo-like [Procambarus clarkii]XP_045620234.1 5' exonuclease Apollo-like [Procambarus clarkii]
MNGCVINGTPIAIDFWKPTKAPQARLFFLTHLHTDHTQGLTRTWRLPIYTSPTNAVLLEHKFKLPKSIMRELEVGETYLIPVDKGGNYPISVTVLDANHVPGAVMFLFQGYFGNILYCGDMRWYPELLDHQVLRNVVEQNALDILYLDNTFSAPYCDFPSREDAKQELFKIIDSYPDHVVKIGIRDLGREDLLEAVARRFQERILVNQSKYELLQLLQYSDAFTVNPEEARIHAVPMNQLQVSAHKKWNQEHPTVSIMLTALYVGWQNGPYSSQHKNGFFTVPYSDHSSYSELLEMVAQLAPHQVIPIVQKWSTFGWWSSSSAPNQMVKADMSVYSHFLTFPPPEPILIPDAIADLMREGGPMLLAHQPRRCNLHRGLTPRPRRTLGVVYTTPECSSSSVSLLTTSPALSRPTSMMSQLNYQNPNEDTRGDLMLKDDEQFHQMPLANDRSSSLLKKVTLEKFTGNSTNGTIFKDQNKQNIREASDDKISKNEFSTSTEVASNYSFCSPTEGMQVNIPNPNKDSPEDHARIQRLFWMERASALMLSQCSLLMDDNGNTVNELSSLVENTEPICDSLHNLISLL